VDGGHVAEEAHAIDPHRALATVRIADDRRRPRVVDHPPRALTVGEELLTTRPQGVGGRSDERPVHGPLFTRTGDALADGVPDAVVGALPPAAGVKEVIAAVVLDHARPLDERRLPIAIAREEDRRVADERDAVDPE